MHPYEIYLASSSSCDEEWEYLGLVQADSPTDALVIARQRWNDYALEDLVAMEAVMPGCVEATTRH